MPCYSATVYRTVLLLRKRTDSRCSSSRLPPRLFPRGAYWECALQLVQGDASQPGSVASSRQGVSHPSVTVIAEAAQSLGAVYRCWSSQGGRYLIIVEHFLVNCSVSYDIGRHRQIGRASWCKMTPLYPI